MYNLGEALGYVTKILIIISCISVPLGIWKIIDIITWCINNIKIGIN